MSRLEAGVLVLLAAGMGGALFSIVTNVGEALPRLPEATRLATGLFLVWLLASTAFVSTSAAWLFLRLRARAISPILRWVTCALATAAFGGDGSSFSIFPYALIVSFDTAVLSVGVNFVGILLGAALLWVPSEHPTP